MSVFKQNIIKSVKVLSFLAIALAVVVGAAASASSASAASLGGRPGADKEIGKLTLSIQDGTKGFALKGAAVLVFDKSGNVVAKGETTDTGFFSTYLAPSTFKVRVTANGYKGFSQTVFITTNQTTFVKVGLAPEIIPPTPAPVPVMTSPANW